MRFTPPAPLSGAHDISTFDCADATLTRWLARRALASQATRDARTYVVLGDERVIGYYALASGSIARQEAPGSIRRNAPDPIPAVVLCRLAADRRCERNGIGTGLLKDAVLRVLAVSEQIGTRVLLCHAVDESAKRFYARFGFVESPIDPLTSMLPLAAVVRAVLD